MNGTLWLYGLPVALVVAGCQSTTPEAESVDLGAIHNSAEGEVEIPLDEVPADIKNAATAAVPGLILAVAEREVEGGQTVYDLEGETPDGTRYEVEVTEAGKVLEVEQAGAAGKGDDDSSDDDSSDDDSSDDD